ncbi:ABC transporter substrate-binding protein [Actinomadura rubrisoli]|uniref:ABC transporter substrate-binding protein n=1 Tax=Actinomadura rubrisoli TaxID=2530368 RepID=A0A4R4ZSS5_9ACTN|nr:ABC transporter substrate-binding protein [Actinomadura rubrisoli]TDD61316.1 ABC transporter substrate-binding protein [Actinomadura rubrisoli]
MKISGSPQGPPLTRRGLLKGGALLAGGLAAAPVLGACGGSGGSGGKRVVVADWGGALVEAEKKYIFEPFSKETGIEVVVAGPPTGAKIKGMVDTGNIEWDLIAGGPGTVLPIGRDYFEPLPDSLLNIPGIDPSYVDKNWLTYYLFSVVMAWNTSALGAGKKLTSWTDFWDTEKFPGRRALRGADNGVPPDMEFAVLGDGVDVKSVYPIDVDRAFRSFDRIKRQVPQWWSSGAQPGQMLVSKQVAASSIFSGRIGELKAKGAPLDFTWNGGMFELASWSVIKDAPNKANAFKLMEYSVRPQVQATVWGKYPNGPANAKALDLMDKEFAKTLPSHPKNLEVQFLQNSEWWGKNRDAVLKRFQQFAAT